jgi:hypothetical protein
MKTITVIAAFQAKPGKENELCVAFHEIKIWEKIG